MKEKFKSTLTLIAILALVGLVGMLYLPMEGGISILYILAIVFLLWNVYFLFLIPLQKGTENEIKGSAYASIHRALEYKVTKWNRSWPFTVSYLLSFAFLLAFFVLLLVMPDKSLLVFMLVLAVVFYVLPLLKRGALLRNIRGDRFWIRTALCTELKVQVKGHDEYEERIYYCCFGEEKIRISMGEYVGAAVGNRFCLVYLEGDKTPPLIYNLRTNPIPEDLLPFVRENDAES